MLKIWGHGRAPNVRKVLWGANELGVGWSLEQAGGPFGGTDTADYRALNPNGRIPTILDGDFVLWESHAILRYLCRRSRDDVLYPTSDRAAALVDQWLDWQGAHQAQAVRDLVRLTVKADNPADPAALARAVDAAETLFAILEDRLARTPHVAGDSFTIADIPVAVGYERWATLPIARPALPATAAWFARVSARPAFPRP